MTKLENGEVKYCDNKEWDECCQCIYYDNCILHYSRFPGLLPILKNYFIKIRNKLFKLGK
jgi:hypothetical protein